MAKGCDLLVSYKARNSRLQRMRVYLAIKDKIVNDKDVLSFLQTTAEKEYITGQPFIYDQEKKSLEFPQGVSGYFKANPMLL